MVLFRARDVTLIVSNGRQVAILFADLTGSSRLYAKYGDQKALELVGKCVELMEQVTSQFGGRVIKTIGDEVMAAFTTGALACEAAMEMNLSVTNQPSLASYGLTLHCGMHFGDVMINSASDVFGDTVNIAARLRDASKAGQILTSGEVVHGLPEALKSKTRYVEAELLKGRLTVLELYEVNWEPDGELTEYATTATVNWTLHAEVLRIRYQDRELELAEASAVIKLGRDADSSDIVILDRRASRHHARIELLRGRFVYTDVSANGSFVEMAQSSQLVRRDAIVLLDRGTISFGASESETPGDVVHFEIIVKT